MESTEGITVQPEKELTLDPSIIPKSLIFTPQQFDQLVLSQQFPSENLLGCHVTALTRVNQDFQGNLMDKKEWIQLFPKNTRKLGIGRFKKEFGGYFEDPMKLIRENRTGYDSSAGIMDALAEQHPELATNPNLYSSIVSSFYESQEAYDAMEKKVEGRKGIQLIYGGAGFLDYLKENDQRDDPEWFGVVRILRRVPSAFISAVIPLGSYEQQLLAH